MCQLLFFFFFSKQQMSISASSYFILDTEEPFGFLFEHHETGWEDLPQQESRAQLFFLKAVVPGCDTIHNESEQMEILNVVKYHPPKPGQLR